MNSMELNDLWMFIYGFPGTYPRKIIIFDLFRSIEDNPINCGSFMMSNPAINFDEKLFIS